MPLSSNVGRFLAAPPQPHTLRKRLVWLAVFRTVAVSLSLVAVAVRLFLQPLAEPSGADKLTFTVIGLVYLFTLVCGLMLRGGWAVRLAAVVQVVGDLLVASVLVLLGGLSAGLREALDAGIPADRVLGSREQPGASRPRGRRPPGVAA